MNTAERSSGEEALTPQHNGAVPPAIRVPDAPITLSTASVYPEKVPSAFEIAALLGYDGIEVMVSTDASSQDLSVLRRLSDYHQVPIKSIHAPCLLLTQRVWGREPWGKLVRSKEVAEELGADVVVVHPPFRWQREYARDFVEGLARMQDETDVQFAVENMFPLKARGAEAGMYLPDWNPIDQDYPYVTLDLSHTAVSGSDALDMAGRLGDRLRHIHLADGIGITNKDEHLVPGRGNQPCGAMLEKLADDGYRGHIVLEVNTRRAVSRAERVEDLAEALAFARLHLAAASFEDGLDRPLTGAAPHPPSGDAPHARPLRGDAARGRPLPDDEERTWEVTSSGEVTRRGAP